MGWLRVERLFVSDRVTFDSGAQVENEVRAEEKSIHGLHRLVAKGAALV